MIAENKNDFLLVSQLNYIAILHFVLAELHILFSVHGHGDIFSEAHHVFAPDDKEVFEFRIHHHSTTRA